VTDWLTDREALAEQYANASNLNDRIALHERYSTNDDGLWHWVFDRFDLPNRARVLSVGCGPADLWGENAGRIPEGWDVTVTDLSPGMVGEARENLADCSRLFALAVAAAESIPFRSNAFDAATANFMLYHVPDRKRALAEIRRVLKPDGTLLAATSGAEHLQELRAVQEGVHGEALPRVTSFRLENGREQLDPFFESVACHRYDDALAVTEVEPLVA
jgi:ubiquinone/menaquinone biosynthesis C-methylase UbiE